MFGPVSISGSFPQVAKDMLIFYYWHYFGIDKNIIEPRLTYQYSTNVQDIKEIFLLNDRKKDFKILKSSLNNMGLLYLHYLNNTVKFVKMVV